MKNAIKNIEEMIIRENDKLEKLYDKICATNPDEQEKLKRMDMQYENLRNYIMGLETAKELIKNEGE